MVIKNNLFLQVNDLINSKKTMSVSSNISTGNTLNSNTINVTGTDLSSIQPVIKSINDDIADIRKIVSNIKNYIISGMDVYAIRTNGVAIAPGTVLYNGNILKYNTTGKLNNNDIHITISVNLNTIGIKYIIAKSTDGNASVQLVENPSTTDVLIAKIVINDVNGELEDKANSDRTNNYIVSGKDLVLNPSFTIDDDTKFALRNVLTELMAENVIGTLRLNDNLTISNQQNSVVLDSTSMKILDDEIRLAEFNKDGVYFYNEAQEMLSQYTKDGATIGQIKITPTSLQSLNFKSGSNGFQILSDGNVEFNDIVARGTIIARAGTIGGVTIANRKLYIGDGTFGNSNTGYYLDADGNFSLKDKLTWNGTTLNINGAITAISGTIGGWSIGATALTGGNATLSSTGYLNLGTSNDIARLDASDTTYRLWVGNATAASAPFSVTKAGAIKAESGTIAGWDIQAGLLRSVASTTANRIELNKTLNRVSVFDTVNEKVVMGYLDGLPKNDGTGNWGSGDYGFWARSGDKLSIDGDGEYINGDWIIQHDASYLVNDSSDKTIIRLGTGTGTDIGEKGLFIYNTSGTTLAKLVSDKIFIGEATKYLQYTTAEIGRAS
ncbi:MAG: hypothetical protein PHN69_04190, partial [Candidatus Pacebacteria bacterium]|nr:hypothetical protein [Candidatus Paceibacterota bacterium]